jgi:hypothetical protein
VTKSRRGDVCTSRNTHTRDARRRFPAVSADEGISVLDEHWRGILRGAPSAIVKVDLANVMFIDAHGQRLLQRMAQCGVEFHTAGLLNQYVIDRIAGGL